MAQVCREEKTAKVDWICEGCAGNGEYQGGEEQCRAGICREERTDNILASILQRDNPYAAFKRIKQKWRSVKHGRNNSKRNIAVSERT